MVTFGGWDCSKVNDVLLNVKILESVVVIMFFIYLGFLLEFDMV